MSNTINTNAIQIQLREVSKVSEIYNKVPEYSKKKKESPSFEVDISEEGRAKLKNSTGPTKKAGVTATREAWENNSAELKRESLYKLNGQIDLIELMRLDEPDTYAKWNELSDKAWALFPSEDASDEEIAEFKRAIYEEGQVWTDWYNRRCMSNGQYKLSRTGRGAALVSLEDKYSTKEHDTSFNFSATGGSGKRDSIWRFCSKFNVLLSSEMYKSLDKLGNINTSSKDKSAVSDLLERIDKAVNEMKNAEKEYEGNLQGLQFGVKLWDDGRVTYHARYVGNEDGIMADSAEELLGMLMKK